MDRDLGAHELRTPLTTIKGVLRLLASGRFARFSPDDAADLIERAWQQLRRLEDVVRDVEEEFASRPDSETAVVLYEERVA